MQSHTLPGRGRSSPCRGSYRWVICLCAPQGQRNAYVVSLAGTMYRREFDPDAADEALRVLFEAICVLIFP